MNITKLNKRIKSTPFNCDYLYQQPDGNKRIVNIFIPGDIDYTDLTDQEKMLTYILSVNYTDLCASKYNIAREFNWSNYKVGKIAKELKEIGLTTVPTYSEETGKLNGKGYWFQQKRK